MILSEHSNLLLYGIRKINIFLLVSVLFYKTKGIAQVIHRGLLRFRNRV